MNLYTWMHLRGVYKLQNLVTGQTYIGQSTNLNVRLFLHIRDSKRKPTSIGGSTFNPQLRADFQTYGLQNFDFEILEQCSAAATRAVLLDLERKWIAIYLDRGIKLYNRTR